VHLIARGLSSVPVHTYTFGPDGERRQVRSDLPQGPGRPPAEIALDQMAQEPAPGISRRKAVFKTAHDMAIFGNGVQAFNWGDYGPTELWPVPWRRINVYTTDPMTILAYEAWGATGRRTLYPEQVVHFTWGDDPESAIGVSPIESLQYTIALHNAIDRHLVSYYGNAARPSGILKLDRMPSEPDVNRILEQFRQLYTAPESAGNVVITSGEYEPIAEATGVPTLAQLIELSREEILGVYGVDPPMIGVLKNAIKSNFQEAREKFTLDTLGPWAVLFESEWAAQMIHRNPLWAYHWWEFDLDARMRPDIVARAQMYANMESTLTINERRRKENLPRLPFPEADTVWAGSGRIPVGFGTPTTTSDNNPEPPIPELGPGAEQGQGGTEDPDDEDEDPEDEEE
jgi:HK97 family phage portal protein